MSDAGPPQAPIQPSAIWLSLALVVLVQMTCWTLVPVLTNNAPPLDVVENIAWGTEHVIATYKNPALSSLLVEASRMLTGAFR